VLVAVVYSAGEKLCLYGSYCGYPGRYYGVLRNTGVIPAVFERYFQGVTCTMGARACSKSVEGYVNVLKRYGLGIFGRNITGIMTYF
jgi:hypothetical protein